MNIPYAILKQKEKDKDNYKGKNKDKGKEFLNDKCYEYHQDLAKKFFNLTKKNKSPKKKTQYTKKKIINWFFQLDIKKKLKICCIYNNWFMKILGQLLTYNDYDISIRFQPRPIYENLYKLWNPGFDDKGFNCDEFLQNLGKDKDYYPEKYFSTFFEGKENHIPADNTNKSLEKEFLNEIRFFSLNEYNDTLSLNEELLNNKEKMSEYFDTFTGCNIFSDNIQVIKINSNGGGVFNFTLPNWVKEFPLFSIPQLITICFEISISIYYQIYSLDKSIPKFDIDSKIEDLYNMKLSMENYIAKEINNEHNAINKILEKKYIDTEMNLQSNNEIYIENENMQDFVYKQAFNSRPSSYYSDPTINDETIINTLNSLRKELKTNIPQFVNSITFIKANQAFKIEFVVYKIIYQDLNELCTQRNLDELCMDINGTSKSKKKRKKNKKNKGKMEESSIPETKEKEEDKKEEIHNNNIIITENNHNFEDNEINLNDNKFSINAEDNKNNSNNSEDEEDEENQIFSNDYYNEIENSKNINNINTTEENIKECIVMKYLDEKGKEIINEEKKEESKEKEKEDKKIEEKEMEKNDENKIIEELLMENTKEKKTNKKNKKKKNKNKNKKKNTKIEENNIETKKEEKKEEPKEVEKIINNNSVILDKSEVNLTTKEKHEISKDNHEHNKEETKSKKKYKDFFLYPVENKKEKKTKNINNKSDNKNSNKKNLNNDEDKNLSIKNESSDKSISQTTTTEKKEMNEIINTNNDINDSNKSLDFSETKESKVSEVENKNENKNAVNIIDKSNQIEHTHSYNKIQNINVNHSTINTYVIIDKKHSNKSLPFENQDFQSNIFPQLLSSPFNYSMPFHQFPNYFLYERNELFYDLAEEIFSHEKNINNNLSLLETYRKTIYDRIKNFILNVLNKNNFEAKLLNYGSHETGLSIEFSDIDILIKFCKMNNINNINICINNQQSIEEILGLLHNEFNQEKEKFNILQINAIYTASVPVLKIKCNLEDIIPKEIQKKIKENYVFNFEEDILQLNFDFTFQEVKKIDDEIKIPSLEIIPYVKKLSEFYKEIKPIILILKRYMKINKLNSSFHGGLSSYSLFLLLYSYLKYIFIPSNSLGHYLYGFFEFYSNFNFGIYLINPNSDCPFILLEELHECGMMLIDPITSLNVAKSTFRIDQIKSVFTKGVVKIRNIFFTNKGKDYIHNLNNDKNIFLNELFKNKNGTMIVENIIQQIQLKNNKIIGK